MYKLHHVGILTGNIEEALQYYGELLGCPIPRIVAVEKPGMKLRSAMLPVGQGSGGYLQLIEPAEGPGLEELNDQGEGTLYEVAFEVEEIEKVHDQMASRDIVPIDFTGGPIQDKFILASSGNRYFYLPKEKTRGTRIEIIQVCNK